MGSTIVAALLLISSVLGLPRNSAGKNAFIIEMENSCVAYVNTKIRFSIETRFKCSSYYLLHVPGVQVSPSRATRYVGDTVRLNCSDPASEDSLNWIHDVSRFIEANIYLHFWDGRFHWLWTWWETQCWSGWQFWILWPSDQTSLGGWRWNLHLQTRRWWISGDWTDHHRSVVCVNMSLLFSLFFIFEIIHMFIYFIISSTFNRANI